jgi:hypothetical protein
MCVLCWLLDVWSCVDGLLHVCVVLVLDACLELETDWFVVLDFWFL